MRKPDVEITSLMQDEKNS